MGWLRFACLYFSGLANLFGCVALWLSGFRFVIMIQHAEYCLKTEITKASMIIRTASLRPMKKAVAFVDR